MTERAAHLVDSVFPDVPVRQWVLSLPQPLRYAMAFDHRLSLKVLRIFSRALMSFMRRRAKRAGIADGRSGGVTVMQRFSSDLRLNLHFHSLMLDGVFFRHSDGALAFHSLPPPTDDDVARLVATVRKRVLRLLVRQGLVDQDGSAADDADPSRGVSPALAALASASLNGVRAFGPDAGKPLRRIGHDPDAPWVCSRIALQARVDGFDLHAAVTVPAGNAEAREGLCRYLLRPPVAQDRLELLPSGNVELRLKTPWRDGTTHVSFEPLELLARLATLIPRPRKNTLIYHGVLAGNAKWRPEVVAFTRGERDSTKQLAPHQPSSPAGAHAAAHRSPAAPRRRDQRHQRWADLMRRAFGIDVLECPRCFGRLRLIATIESPPAVAAILMHLGLPTHLPQLAPARAPPQLDFAHADHAAYGVDAPDCWN